MCTILQLNTSEFTTWTGQCITYLQSCNSILDMYVHIIIIHINGRVLCVELNTLILRRVYVLCGELNTLILRQCIMCGTQYFNFTTGYCVELDTLILRQGIMCGTQ